MTLGSVMDGFRFIQSVPTSVCGACHSAMCVALCLVQADLSVPGQFSPCVSASLSLSLSLSESKNTSLSLSLPPPLPLHLPLSPLSQSLKTPPPPLSLSLVLSLCVFASSLRALWSNSFWTKSPLYSQSYSPYQVCK